MIKTVEIERRPALASPRPAPGRVGVALVASVCLHALAGVLLAVIIFDPPPAIRSAGEPQPILEVNFAMGSRERPAPVEVGFLSGLPVPPPPRWLARPRARHSDLPVLTIPEPEVAIPVDGEDAFGAPFMPPEKSDAEGGGGAEVPPVRPDRRVAPKAHPEATRPTPRRLPTALTPAEVRQRSKPYYPESARRRGQEGTAYVRLSVDAEGEVTAASISKSSGHPLLDASALKAASRWKFAPARTGGQPVGTEVIVPIRFKLG
jgi:protein TonB